MTGNIYGKYFKRRTNIDEELAKMKENIENNSKSTQKRIRLKDLMNGPVLKPFSISIGIMIFQQTSGVSAIIFNTVSIFRKAGSNLDSHYATIIVGFVQLVFTVASGFFVKLLMYFFINSFILL